MALSLRSFSLLCVPLAGLLVLAVACGDDEPAVEITTPKDGEDLDAGDVQVAVEVENFEVVDKLGEEPKDGEGHVHYYIDVEEVPTKQGEPAVTEEGTYHAEATKSFTWEDVDPGEHTFAVQLVNNDHTPLDPPVVEEVTVTVGGGGDEDEEPTGTPGRSPSPSPEEEETEAATPTQQRSPIATTPARSPTPTP